MEENSTISSLLLEHEVPSDPDQAQMRDYIDKRYAEFEIWFSLCKTKQP